MFTSWAEKRQGAGFQPCRGMTFDFIPFAPYILFRFPTSRCLSTFDLPKRNAEARNRWIPWRKGKQRPPKVRRFWIWCRDIERRCRFLISVGGGVWWWLCFWEGRFVLEDLPLFFGGGESLDWWLVKKNGSTLPCWNWDWLFATGYFF